MKLTTLTSIFALALAATVSGCTAETTGGEEPEVAEETIALDAADADEDAPREARPHHRGHRGGPDKIFRVALKTLTLDDGQRATIEATVADLRDGMGPPPDAEQHREALVAAVRAGSVDPDALMQPAEIEAHMLAGRSKLVAALDTLHETLTPEQRAQLVANIQEHDQHRWDKRGKRGDKPRGPEGARGGEREERGPHGAPHGAPHGRNPLGFMLHGLEVSDTQREQIQAALAEAGMGPDDRPSREEMKAHFEAKKEQRNAMLTAFAGADFDAETSLPKPPADHVHKGPHRMLQTLAVVVPLLDETQRNALADKIAAGPPGHEGRRGKHRGHHGKHRGGPAAQ